ncbi:MAG: lysophospholipid acyltransferase family protein [Vicinamibacterales bacterium]
MPTTPPAGPHAPALGWSHRVFGQFHVTGVFWYRFPYWAIGRAPLWMHGPAIVVFTAFFFVVLGRIRRAIIANLEPVLGPATALERGRRAWRTMYEFARGLSERFSRLTGHPRGTSAVEGLEHWAPLRTSQAGAVIVTAHIGPWESATVDGADDVQRTVHVVREAEIDPRAQDFVREILQRQGRHYVAHFAGEDDRLVLTLVDALRRGEIVALQGDRPRATGRAMTVPLFGQAMPLPIGPAVLARAAGVPLVPVFAVLEADYTVHTVIRPPITVARTTDRDADLTVALTALATEIETAIRRAPHQWYCFRQLWP